MKIEQEMFVQMRPAYPGQESKPVLFDMDMSKGCSQGYIHITTVMVTAEFEMPGALEIRDTRINNIKGMIQKEKADAQVKVEQLENEIQQLLAITA